MNGEIRNRAREVAAIVGPRAAETDRTESYPWYAVHALRDAGLMGMTMPKTYGGSGASYVELVGAIEEVAKACGATGRIMVESNVGAIGAIMRYGSEKQKRLSAELVLSGDKPAICITEPQAGSAASELTTRADRRGDTYVITGRKHWITGGGVSRLHLIFARVFEDGEEQGIAGFIAVRDDAPEAEGAPPGMRFGKREPVMGIRGIPERELIFEGLVIPRDMLLVPSDGMRRGFAQLMDAYNAQRLGAAAVALGIAQGAYELAIDYANRREQFGRPLAEFQGLQWMLADASIALSAARALIAHAARSACDGGFPDMADVARAKVFAAEAAFRVTSDALQIFGAAGYSREQPLERMLRDARMFTISGGTAQILRTQIAARILDRRLPQTRDGYPAHSPGHMV